MSRSVHQIAVKGKDETGGAFASIQSRASAASAEIRSMLGGAIAAAGAYIGVRTISGTIQQLGQLSDLAMRTGSSVEDLTRAATAFQIAGLPLSVDALGRALMYLKKNTGKEGMEAFLSTAREIAAIGDGAKRGEALVKNFGRAGLELQPLVSGGAETVDNFAKLAALMPHVTQASANAGKAVADAQTLLSKGVQMLWQRAIGRICAMWGDDFPGGVRAGALNAVNWLEYALKKMFNSLNRWGTKIALAGQAIFNWLGNGYSWEQAWSEFGETNALLDADLDAQAAKIEKFRADYLATLKSVDLNALAKVFGGARRMGETIGEEAAKAAKRVSNELILGGTNAAQKLAILGPTIQSETRKQTELLEKIAENTEKTADNTDEAADAYSATDLGV